MTNLGPLARTLGVAGLIAALAAYAAPVFAGPAEIALLKSYEGTWRGAGQLSGSSTDKVSCRMALSPGNDEKVNYSGRCLIAGGNLSINGTLAYIEASHRYEGVMTSNVNFSGVAVGVKQGSGIAFNLKSRGSTQDATYDIAVSITLTPGVITVNFTGTDVASGQSATARIPFSKV